MPQFDIASFFPQISFFVGIFLLFYVFLAKNFLPLICQNLKFNHRILDLFRSSRFDLNSLSYLYHPSLLLSSLIYKECLCLLFLQRTLRLLLLSYLSSLRWLFLTYRTDLQVRLFTLNRLYLRIFDSCL